MSKNIDSCDLHNAFCEAQNLLAFADELPSNAPKFSYIAKQLSDATSIFIQEYQKICNEIEENTVPGGELTYGDSEDDLRTELFDSIEDATQYAFDCDLENKYKICYCKEL